MTKNEYISSLGARLSGLPKDEIRERLAFYGEMIDDRIEEGLAEEEAVADVGDVEDIAAQIIAETPLAKIVKDKIKPKRRLQAWEIVLIALGSPVWLSLAVAALAVVFAVLASVWAVVAVIWSVLAAVAASGAACVALGVCLMLLLLAIAFDDIESDGTDYDQYEYIIADTEEIIGFELPDYDDAY